MSINSVTISGNLTRDAEMRRTPSGLSIVSFGVAVNDRRKNSQTGEWEEYANFIDCTMFGSRAEALSAMLVKGAKVFVQGKLRYSSWNSNGDKRSKVSVLVDNIDLAPRKQPNTYQDTSEPNATPQNAPQAPEQVSQQVNDQSQGNFDFYDETLPF